MKINSVSMTGFKNSKKLMRYELGDKTIVSGENGRGKTTLGEAITYCLIGTDLTGNERAANRLLNDKSKNMEVAIDFETNEGSHNLIRTRRGSKNSIYLDGNEVSNNDLIQFYKDKDTFLSVFNPSYFPGLAPKQAKEFLNKTLEEVKNEEVFKNISDFEKDLLIKNNFKNPNLFLERKRAELKEIEGDLIYAEGFIAAKKEDIEIPHELAFDEAELKTLHEKRALLDEKVRELKQDEKAPLVDVDSLKKELEFTRNRYIALKEELNNLNNTVKCPNCNFEIDLDLNRKSRLMNELDKLEKDGKRVADKVKQYETENIKIMELYEKTVENKKTKLKEITDEYKAVSDAIRELENKKREVESNNATRDRLLELQKENEVKIEKAREDIENSDKRKSEIKMQMDAAKNFNSTKLKIQSENIKQHLNKVEIQLERMTKEGEIIDDFKILYDGKEFNILSNSERIKAGLEIANLVMNSTGMKFPIFIDNAESITNYAELDAQIIEARVVEGQELKAEVI